MELWRKVILFHRGLGLQTQVLLEVGGVGTLRFEIKIHNFLYFPSRKAGVKTPGSSVVPSSIMLCLVSIATLLKSNCFPKTFGLGKLQGKFQFNTFFLTRTGKLC